MAGLLMLGAGQPAAADPALECGTDAGSQVETGACLEAEERRVDAAIAIALGFVEQAAQGIDEATGRPLAVDALEDAQQDWEAYRTAQCDFIGTLYGGGSGTGIAIRSCRVTLGRARVAELMLHAR